MRKTKYLLLIMLLALVALVFIPNTSNAAVSVERILLTNDGSMKFKFSGLNLDTTHEYVFGFEKTSAIESTKWYAITDFTETTATVNITTNSSHKGVFDAGDKGYITIKDKTNDTIVEKSHEVDLKIPYLNVTNFKVVNNGREFDLYEVNIPSNSGGTRYYQYEKITDQNVISKYKEIKKLGSDMSQIQSLLKTEIPSDSNWKKWANQSGYRGRPVSKVKVNESGLYYLWVYVQQTNVKDIYGYILVDNLEEKIALTSISLPSTKEVELGKALTLTPTFNPSNTTDKTVTWTSSDESVATVNSNGVVTPKKVGSTIITVTSNVGKKTAKCTVTVKSSSSTTTDGWTDTSNTKIKIKKENEYGSFSITTENITYNSENRYYIYITSGKNKPTYTTESNNKITFKGCTELIVDGKVSSLDSTMITKALELNGDVYAWVVESKMNSKKEWENKFILEAYKVERPVLNDIGKRFSLYFMSAGITTLHNFNPSYNEEARKVKIKIGTINDNAILKSLYKKEAGALNKLLTYAKSAKAVYTDSLKIGTTNLKISDKMKITSYQFYYVYLEFEDENGKYYPVEDVMLYQGLDTSLYNYLDGNLKWNFNDENDSTSTPTDTTITPDKKLPQTGEKIAIIGTIGIAVVVTIVLGIKAKKYNF